MSCEPVSPRLALTVLAWALLKLFFLLFRALRLIGEQGCHFVNRVTPELPYDVTFTSHDVPAAQTDPDPLRLNVKSAFTLAPVAEVMRELELAEQRGLQQEEIELQTTHAPEHRSVPRESDRVVRCSDPVCSPRVVASTSAAPVSATLTRVLPRPYHHQRPGRYYAVAFGERTGIFRSWDETQPLVDGYPGNRHQMFRFRWQAEDYLHRHGVPFDPEDSDEE